MIHSSSLVDTPEDILAMFNIMESTNGNNKIVIPISLSKETLRQIQNKVSYILTNSVYLDFHAEDIYKMIDSVEKMGIQIVSPYLASIATIRDIAECLYYVLGEIPPFSVTQNNTSLSGNSNEILPQLPDEKKENPMKTHIVFTLDQLKNDLVPIYVQALKDCAEEFVNGNRTDINSMNLNDHTLLDLSEAWVDIISHSFFEKNPHIEEVLCYYNNKKHWLCSNPDLRK